MWAVRLAGDQVEIELSVLGRMKIMAYLDANIEVLCQLACTAKRMQYYGGNVILEGLLHNQVEPDQRLPLLTWWGFESFCDRLGSEVVRDGESLKRPIAQKHLASRLMQRFAATGSQKDLLICAKLFASSPDAETTKQFLAGFEEAYKGRALVNLPPELVAALAKAGGGSLALRVRQKEPQALAEALAIIADNKQKLELRTELIHILAELKHAAMIGPALQLVMLHEPLELRQTALMALQVFDEPHISRVLLLAYRDLPAELKTATQSLLVSRPRTTKELLEAVDAERIKPSDVPLEIVRKMLLRPDAEIEAAVKKHWGTIEGATTEAIRIQVAKLGEVIRAGQGDPKAGQKLYMESCGKCHTLFGQGGEIGPNLTADKRDDIERMLLNILNPSAEIREGYESQLIVTDDGRILQGFIIEQNPQQITLRGTDGQTTIIPRDEIEEQQRLGRSLMPEGLLDKLSEQQVRDLFAYLRITQPLVK
jgi:putative heme-binding domain-containing protein